MPTYDQTGSGAIFPVTLSKLKNDKTGKYLQVPKVKAVENADGTVTVTPELYADGTPKMVDAVSWLPLTGYDLINNNLQSLFSFQIGQKMRAEDFGSRLWEAIEESNTTVQAAVIKEFLKQGIKTWETRITFSDCTITQDQEKLYIDLTYKLGGEVQTVSLEYNSQTDTYDAY
jgi:phage baseplate assembly protein W